MQRLTSPQLALIGTTASGKSSLALELAEKYAGIILSLDSLSIYRHIDIASAKPTAEERNRVPHLGIDILNPDEIFDVTRYQVLYREALQRAREKNVPLFIVGGSSFYLKILLEGISPLPSIDPEVSQKVNELLKDLDKAYRLLRKRAPRYAESISSGDRYRIEKGLLILLQSGQDPRDYFATHSPQPIIEAPLPLLEIVHDREVLRQRISLRTDTMLHSGLVDEVAWLESVYGRAPNAMKAIGIKEVLDYLDGRYGYDQMREKIIINTARLAKRQSTFNRSQFSEVFRGDIPSVRSKIEDLLTQT